MRRLLNEPHCLELYIAGIRATRYCSTAQRLGCSCVDWLVIPVMSPTCHIGIRGLLVSNCKWAQFWISWGEFHYPKEVLPHIRSIQKVSPPARVSYQGIILSPYWSVLPSFLVNKIGGPHGLLEHVSLGKLKLWSNDVQTLWVMFAISIWWEWHDQPSKNF
jgi:hypothetical protein